MRSCLAPGSITQHYTLKIPHKMALFLHVSQAAVWSLGHSETFVRLNASLLQTNRLVLSSRDVHVNADTRRFVSGHDGKGGDVVNQCCCESTVHGSTTVEMRLIHRQLTGTLPRHCRHHFQLCRKRQRVVLFCSL